MAEHELTDTFDALVVGGGPAGALCSRLLARSGWRVYLVNRQIGRDGVIELVSDRAGRILYCYLDGFLNHRINGVDVRDTVARWGGDGAAAWSGHGGPWRRGTAVNRLEFDAALRNEARAAGVIGAQGEVTAVEFDRGRWLATVVQGKQTTVLRAHQLVLTTGRTAKPLVDQGAPALMPQTVLRTRMLSRRTEADPTVFLEAIVEGAWWYALPDCRGGHFVGFYGARAQDGGDTAKLSSYFMKAFSQCALMSALLPKAAICHPVAVCEGGLQRTERVGGPAWVAIGDAACALDQLSGQGIEFSLESAVQAVELLLAGLDNEGLDRYAGWIAGRADAWMRERHHYRIAEPA